MADDVTLPGTGEKVDTRQQPDGSHQQVIQVDGELLTVMQALEMAIQQMVKSIGLSLPDVAGRLRVSLDATTGALTIGTVTNVTTVGTVTNVTTVGTVTSMTNQVNMGGYSAAHQVPALMQGAIAALRNQITVS